ncbi:hypothetical protein FO519_008575 [Halicephalobus sp. NKZ332]|nr:hypothetical protein FO519_008575 [Halicephalobus sp. NKZ332]
MVETSSQAIGTGAQPTRTCNTCEQNSPPPPPPVAPPPPQWNSWGPWSSCSASCGSGFQTRTRTCNTQCGVCQCQGPSTEQQPCNGGNCCDWTLWTPWSECSVTCGSGGVKYRTRQCTCLQCSSGSSNEQEACNGPYQCPTTCSVCGNPPPPPPPPPSCNTCNQPPPPACSTCGGIGGGTGIGMGANAYYDPYRNGRRKN